MDTAPLTCIACHSDRVKSVVLPFGHPAAECTRCHLVWATDIQTSKNIYDSAYDKSADFTWTSFLKTHEKLMNGQPVDLHWYEEDFLKTVSPTGDKKLLEIGCSIGRFLHSCQKSGWTIHGLDISEKAVTYARQLLPDADIQCGTIEKNSWSEDSFEAIAAWEILEHVENPVTFFRKAADLLKTDGVLTVSTPDWGSWAIRRHPKINYWPPYHIWFFSEKNLKLLLSDAGLEVVGIKRNLLPWSETCYSRFKRILALPFLVWKGLVLRQGGGRPIIHAKKISSQ